MVDKVTLVGKEVEMLHEILQTCTMYYEAIGDENNAEVVYCNHLESLLKENTIANNEIVW